MVKDSKKPNDIAKITHYLCINCPLGCRLEVKSDNKEIVEVRGHGCKRGDKYAREEHTQPVRMVTTTVAVVNGLWARLPVKTDRPVPKERVVELCESLRGIKLKAPIKMGDTIVLNALGLEVNIIASRDMPKAKKT